MASSERVVTVLLVENDFPISKMTKEALEADVRFEYLGCVINRNKMMERIDEVAPDLIVIDLQLPVNRKKPTEPLIGDLNFDEGLEMISLARERSPQSKIVAFSNFLIGNPHLAKTAIERGADAVLPKQNAPDSEEGWNEWFTYNLRSISRGEFRPDANTAKLLEEEESSRSWGDERLNRLSDRQLQVLRCLVEDKKDAQISQELSISVATVRSHISNIFHILHLRGRQELRDSMKRRKRPD